MSSLTILEPGPLATIQDRGRAGQAALGVPASGACDRSAYELANRLVGNRPGAAALEVTFGGLVMHADVDLVVAITGAPCTGVPLNAPATLRAGQLLRLGPPATGLRTYVAVRGGIDVPTAVGSRSTDTMAGLGPAPLQQDDELMIGPEPATPIPVTDLAPWGAPRDDLEVTLAPGPRAEWFAASALSTLFESTWTVSAQGDRVGIRLDGPELERTRVGELPSEGMVPGALQVPPTGRPTILLADGPVTGGYPVVAVVTEAALDLLGQARPGTRIRFRHAR